MNTIVAMFCMGAAVFVSVLLVERVPPFVTGRFGCGELAIAFLVLVLLLGAALVTAGAVVTP